LGKLRNVRVALMILMAYLSYILAEVFFHVYSLLMQLIPILIILFQESQPSTHVFATLSFIAEIFIFLYVGMDALDIEKWRFISQSPGKSVGISSVLLGLILVGRAAFVFPLSFLSNFLQKSPHVKIDMKQQVTIWWSGLMRGAVSIALAYNQPFQPTPALVPTPLAGWMSNPTTVAHAAISRGATIGLGTATGLGAPLIPVEASGLCESDIEAVEEINFSVSEVKSNYKDDGLNDSSKIVAFDFDGCLTKTAVNKVGADTWSLMYPSIPDKL
ncbi:hypothetical protein S245_024762, partial [Arachis hypogaea]